MQSLCYLDLPQLCLSTLYHPSLTMGDPLTASKRPETSPKPTNFPLSTSNVISVQSYHSKNDHAITVLSRPTSTVSRHTISPISDHGDPSQPQSGQKQAPNQQVFLCPPPMRLVCNCITVKMTTQSLCYLDLPQLF